MARVTVEDCLARVPNRFALTVLGSRRARAISEGRGRALVECENKEGVTALREISADRVRYKEDVEATLTDFIEEQRRQLRVTTGEHTFLEAASLRALEDDDEDEDGVDEPDVEELQTDPEKLNKQAQGADDDDDEDDDDEGSDDDDDDAPAADPDDLDTEALGDEADDDDNDDDDDDDDDDD
jgi:DNA-directed RNA polymerase omega subunit